MKTAAALAFDREHIWHPYSTLINPPLVFPVARAEGVHIELQDGTRLIDGMASWWSVIHGYNHPKLNQAITGQIQDMAHVMFGGLTHRPAIDLAARLVEITPAGLQRVFFADSGSVAVEVAIKMALQYQIARARPGRHKLLTIRGGYHGDTFAAMSVCDPVTGMHGLFSGALPQQLFAPRPTVAFADAWRADDIGEFKRIATRHADDIAAVILEPVVQGAGGMWFYHPRYLTAVREICDELDLLLILDEIATGFGRSGELFGCEHAQVQPDILCLGKALTGGYMTLAATLANDEVAETICNGDPGLFMHGPTFMANPLACAVALASIDLLLDGPWQANISRIERGLRAGLTPCAGIDGVRDVRVLGAIGVVETERPADMYKMAAAFVERGVWIRPFGTLFYLMPPYIIDDADLATLTAALTDVVATLT